MSGRRIERLNEQLRRELTELLRTQVRDPRVLGATVTYVRTTSDLWLARVYVRVDGTDAEKRETMVGLRSAAPFLRRSLSELLEIRRIPELRFEEDESLAHAERIEDILREIDVPPAPGDPGAGEEE